MEMSNTTKRNYIVACPSRTSTNVSGSYETEKEAITNADRGARAHRKDYYIFKVIKKVGVPEYPIDVLDVDHVD